MKTILKVNNLYCSECSAKIEKRVTKIPGIENVSINMGTGKMYLEGKVTHEVIDEINKIAASFEKGVTITKLDDIHDHGNSHSQISKRSLILNGVGVILFITAIIVQFAVLSGVNRGTYWYYYMPIYLVSYLLLGHDVIWLAVKRIVRKEFFDENFLMSIATIGAFAIGEYFEAVAVMLFYKIGEMFQDIAVGRSRKSINSLMDLRPETANLVTNEGITVVSPKTLQLGDIVQVKVGESLPIDGVIIQGKTSLDVKHLTGESLPVDIGIQGSVMAGSINLINVILVKVTSLYNDSSVAKIIEFIESNADKKSNQEKFITKFSKIYTPIIVIIGFLVAFVLPGIMVLMKTDLVYGNILADYVHKALVFLVASCPCALVLSVPLSYFAGIGKSAREGILVKSGSDLDDLRFIEEVAFDKTGTITKGNFKVVNLLKEVDITDQEFLRIAAHAESGSNHLIAKSIMEAYDGVIDEGLASDTKEISGLGMATRVGDMRVLIGNHRLMIQNEINFIETTDVGTHVYMAVDDKYYGVLIIADEIKSTTKLAIDYLTKQGLSTTMVTGDQEVIASDIASKLNITRYYAQMLPLDKVNVIKKIKETKKVAFVGDGINDAPVLVTANIGIAMGGVGSDIAIESADIVIMNDDLRKVSHAIEISKRTDRVVKTNIIFSLVLKAIVLVLALLLPSNPWMMAGAVFVDVGVSVLATIYATTLLRSRRQDKKYNELIL